MVTQMKKKIHSLLEKLDLNIRKDSALNYENVGLGTSNYEYGM